MNISRRLFLSTGAVGALGALTVPRDSAAADAFSFVHCTDIHIQPELHAADGTRRCFEKINALKPDFAICVSYLVLDACAITMPPSKQIFDLYAKNVKPLNKRVNMIIDNQDV